MANTNHASRPGSPTRHNIKTLPDIPGVVASTTTRPTPGPNAFAQQADRMEKHKLEGNAFYQQEVAKRKATPPTMLHPALRSRSDFQPASPRGPEMMQVRDSGVTTMSAFIDAGKENSPPLKLLPPDSGAFPTRRGVMEEQREQLGPHGPEDEAQTPVYKYTPKIPASSQFSKSVGSATATPRKKGRVSDTAMIIGEQAGSPKKGLLEKLRLPNLRNTPTQSTANLTSKSQYDLQDSVPPKAKAVLGNSPPKSKIPRSPSKRMAFFSRKHSEPVGSNVLKHDAAAQTVDREPQSSSTAGKTPQTASTANFSECHTARTAQSDPTYNRQHESKRVVSQSQSERGADKSHNSQCMVSRSQSLQYFNRERPPTPPAKNTPPHEKERKESTVHKEHQPQEALRIPSLRHEPSLQDDTPTRETVRLIQDGRTSPTRFGGYAHVENPTVVKKPSVYSMHASVFPDLADASHYDEMKAPVDGLGLEGLSDLPESFYQRNPNITYSPSIYSNAWASSPHARFLSTPNLTEDHNRVEASTAAQASIERHRPTASTQTSDTKKSFSSNGTIPFVYPELASDPSVTPEAWQTQFAEHEDRSRATGNASLHGRAQSLGHNHYTRDSMSSIFARSAEDLSNQGSLSPMVNHPSAAPSPLQYLPATVYTPPPRKIKGAATFEQTPTAGEGSPLARMGNELSGERDRTNMFKPTIKRQSNPFDNLPSFPVRNNSALSGRSTSPHNSQSDSDTTDTDPTKITPTSPSFPNGISSAQDTKMDAIMAMLSGLTSQNENISRMRDDICALNARLGQHTSPDSPNQELEQLESTASQPAADPYVPHGGLTVSAARHRAAQSRVSLETNGDVWPAYFDSDRRRDRIARNQDAGFFPRLASETPNAMEQLIDIVGGFAKRMDAIEAMMQRQGGEKRGSPKR